MTTPRKRKKLTRMRIVKPKRVSARQVERALAKVHRQMEVFRSAAKVSREVREQPFNI